jgi:hypothetical protein
MALAGYLILIALLCGAVVWKWGYGAVYPLILLSFTQNLCVPLLYTTGWTGPEASKALIFLKEILLLVLFIYSAWRLLGRGIRIPATLAILIFFTLWCCVRGLFGMVQGDDIANAGRLIRSVCMPLQLFIVGLAAACEQDVAEKLLRRMVPILSVLAVAAVVLFFSLGTEFWVKYANIAAYNIALKGEDPSEQVEDFGVSGSGGGRPEFSFLSDFRAVGTFGDPISMAFAMAFAALLASFYGQHNGKQYLLLLPIGAALFLSFTRSSWIFLIVAGGVIMIRKRKYLLLASTIACVALAFMVPQLSDFVLSSVDKLTTGDPNDLHAAGLRGFYTMAWRDPGNILGKGTAASVQEIPESGYAFLLEHFGLPAYASFLFLNFLMFAQFSRAKARHHSLACIGQGTVAGTLVTMHTSHYAFSFIGYLGIWLTLGALTSFLAADGLITEARFRSSARPI